MGFLAAPLLFGLVLAGLPVLIHLLNRRRFQVVDWAPMKYLKLTIRTNKRRIRIEQLLLLILRTVLVVLLVLAVARPVLSRAGLGGWLARRSRVSRVIVINTALNTGYRAGGRSALDRGKDAVAEILANTGSQDAVTLLTTAPASAPLAREAGPEAIGRLTAVVRDLRPTDAACDWAATFKKIDDCLNTATFPDRQLILVTDLRRSGWKVDPAAVTQLAERWAAARVEARVVDVGSRDTADLALARFAQEDPLALPGTSVRLMAAVRNGTAAAAIGGTATLTVDGDRRPVLLPPLPAGATTDVPLQVTLDRPGPHAVSLAMAADALSGDDVRWLGLDVRERLDLTILDGRVGAGPFESAGDFVQVAATVGRAAWHVRRVAVDTDAAAAHPPAADVAVLADVASLPAGAAADLTKQVRAGMGLIVFAGEQVDPAFYNDQLYANGLLPCRVAGSADGPAKRAGDRADDRLPARPAGRPDAGRPGQGADPPAADRRPARPGPTRPPACWPGGTTPRPTRPSSRSGSAAAASCWSPPRPTGSGPTGRSTRRTCSWSAPWPPPSPRPDAGDANAVGRPPDRGRHARRPPAGRPPHHHARRPDAPAGRRRRPRPAVRRGRRGRHVHAHLDRRRRRSADAPRLRQLRPGRGRPGADRRTPTATAARRTPPRRGPVRPQPAGRRRGRPRGVADAGDC